MQSGSRKVLFLSCSIILIIIAVANYTFNITALFILGATIIALLLANKARKEKDISVFGQENVRLSATLDAICDAIITTDTNEIVTYLNPVASQLTSWSSKEAIGKPLTDVFNIIHKHSRESVQNSAKDVLKTGESVALLANTVLISKDGNEYEISNSCSPIFAPSGEISGVVLAFRDTTEEFRATEELLSSQTLIKTLLNNLPNLIWLKDKNGVFIACNENFSRMYAGSTPEDILGKTDYDFTDKKHADFFRQKDLEALAAGKATRNEEWLTFASDGHCELVETIKTPMSDDNGNLIGVLGIASDITKDRESFAQLQSSELRLKEAQIYAKIGYWELYADQETTTWSPQMYALFGLPGESKAGPELLRLIMNDDDFPDFSSSIKKCFETGDELHVEYRITRKRDGKVRWIECKGKLEYNSEDKENKISGFIQDITDRKNAEEALKQSKATISNKLKAILEPDTEFNELELSDIIDIESLKSLMEDFYHLTGMLGAIVDTKGNTLISVGPQDICANFHRVNPDTRKNCFESDTILSKGAKPGEFKRYRCKNNMWDMATPIIIGDKHLGNVFIGQFFYKYELPDIALFKTQANKYSFDEDMYLNALDKVPRFTQDEVTKAMHFYAKLTSIISVSSLSAIKQAKLLAEREVTLEKLQLSSRVFSDTHEGIIITDAEQKIIDVNPAFTQITGYQQEDIIGKVPSVLNSGKQTPKFYEEMWKSIGKQDYWHGEIWNQTKQGKAYAELLTISSIKNNKNEVTNYIGVFSDITTSKQYQEQLNLMAHYDGLTKLPNRALFVERFNQSIANSMRTGHQFVVCFLDLDDFKPVNDNYGHEVGDHLLIEVASRIVSNIREGDTASRQGGDEFAILLNDIESVLQYETTIEGIHQALAEPYVIDGILHNITASSGVTLYPSDDEDIDTLLRHADHAMYQSKLLGKNRSQLYNPDYEQRIIKKNLQLKEIEQALINNEFQLYYQPKVNMVTGDVFGVEALIRWLHPKKGLIPPLDFLSSIDATPLEIKVGDWVISEALQQLNNWQQQGLKLEVSVNISSNHLTSPSFFMELENRLGKYDAGNAKYLQLEILESSALADINTINHIVNTCQERLGVSFALDDFGTGYSSLTHLRNLPVDTIKIDRSFVRDILDDPSDYSIINSVIALTKSFNRNVIAEGVESTNHGLILLLMGCEQAQGYGIAKPMPADKFKQWLDNYQPINSWVESANIDRNKKQSSLDIFRIVSTYWKDRFERNILLSPDNLLPWPIMDNQQCQCVHWINQQKQEKLFEKNALLQLEKSHQDVHFIASSIKAKYNQGEIETARTMLSSLTIAFEGMLTITESFQ